MTKPQPAPKRRDKRKDADRASRKITLRLPPDTLLQLEQLSDRRGVPRVAVLCDLIRKASK